MSASDNIQVAIRIQPLIEQDEAKKLSVQWNTQNNIIYQIDETGQKNGEVYSFDHIFECSKFNTEIYENIVKKFVESSLNGLNSIIFAYGQTSSGKTYTMMGSEKDKGIVVLAIEDIFDLICKTKDRKFLLRVSYVDIYNERIYDLLDPSNKNVKIKEHFSGAIFAQNVKEEIVATKEQVYDLLQVGASNRHAGATNMNERSSRSHAILKIVIESAEICDFKDQDLPIQVSSLNLVDLAGSERIGQTKTTGGHINKSLSNLSLVIRQLSDGQEYVNFRDSKLTRLLQHSLGGNAKTLIIATITLASIDDTRSTLSFAQRAKAVKNKPQINQVIPESSYYKRYAQMDAELKQRLEDQLAVNQNLERTKEENSKEIQRLREQMLMLETFLHGKKSSIVRIPKRRHTMCFTNKKDLRITEEPETDMASFVECKKEDIYKPGLMDFTTPMKSETSVNNTYSSRLDKTFASTLKDDLIITQLKENFKVREEQLLSCISFLEQKLQEQREYDIQTILVEVTDQLLSLEKVLKSTDQIRLDQTAKSWQEQSEILNDSITNNEIKTNLVLQETIPTSDELYTVYNTSLSKIREELAKTKQDSDTKYKDIFKTKEDADARAKLLEDEIIKLKDVIVKTQQDSDTRSKILGDEIIALNETIAITRKESDAKVKALEDEIITFNEIIARTKEESDATIKALEDKIAELIQDSNAGSKILDDEIITKIKQESDMNAKTIEDELAKLIDDSDDFTKILEEENTRLNDIIAITKRESDANTKVLKEEISKLNDIIAKNKETISTYHARSMKDEFSLIEMQMKICALEDRIAQLLPFERKTKTLGDIINKLEDELEEVRTNLIAMKQENQETVKLFEDMKLKNSGLESEVVKLEQVVCNIIEHFIKEEKALLTTKLTQDQRDSLKNIRKEIRDVNTSLKNHLQLIQDRKGYDLNKITELLLKSPDVLKQYFASEKALLESQIVALDETAKAYLGEISVLKEYNCTHSRKLQTEVSDLKLQVSSKEIQLTQTLTKLRDLEEKLLATGRQTVNACCEALQNRYMWLKKRYDEVMSEWIHLEFDRYQPSPDEFQILGYIETEKNLRRKIEEYEATANAEKKSIEVQCDILCDDVELRRKYNKMKEICYMRNREIESLKKKLNER